MSLARLHRKSRLLIHRFARVYVQTISQRTWKSTLSAIVGGSLIGFNASAEYAWCAVMAMAGIAILTIACLRLELPELFRRS